MKRNKFEEAKIKLVMQLRGLTREEAVKVLDAKRTSDEGADADVLSSGFLALTDEDNGIVSARDFFGD